MAINSKDLINTLDVTEAYNESKVRHMLHQLMNTPGLMDEFNKQLRSYKLDKINKK